jgi:hypothetical protein
VNAYPYDRADRWGVRATPKGTPLTINVNHPGVLSLIQEHRAPPQRWDSAAFLIWYLENYYRLDRQEAIDCVCDRGNDKGVDGIWVNEAEETIVVFQSKLLEKPTRTIGDADLRTFGGTLRQFSTTNGLSAMVAAAGMAQVASLVKRLDILPRLGAYTVRGEFLANVNIDANGRAYLPSCPDITFIGKAHLESHYISDSRDLPLHSRVSFDVKGYKCTEYAIDAKTKAIIAPIKGSDLARLDGISNQSLFAPNVRGPLGKTAINKAIVGSIETRDLHKAFLLFHNGITIICTKLSLRRGAITIEGYYVVNGCQSITALSDHKSKLTKDLRVLTKLILLEKDSPLAATITKFSNNQNGVSDRDFMANHRSQIRLQNEVSQQYGTQYFLDIKRGEPTGSGICITNEEAGLYMMAFDSKEPWATHRRYQVFRDRHSELFGRPEATAHRIVMLRVIMDAIVAACRDLKNDLSARYVLTRYFIMYVIRLVVEDDPIAADLLTKPEIFVHAEKRRKIFAECVGRVAGEIVVDLNYELDQVGPDFDYRDKMRDEQWVRKMAGDFRGTHLKLVKQKRMDTIKAIWDAAISKVI